MKLTTFLALICAVMGQLACAANLVTDAPSQLKRHDGSVISFYLQLANPSSAADTLLIYLQGSDCNSVKHDRFIGAYQKTILPTADLLMVEKSGITNSLTFDANPERPDCPAAYLEYDSPTQRALDLATVASKVLDDTSYKQVVVLGGSEGAAVAALYAAQSSVPNAVVLINGGGRWFLDDVLYSIKASSKNAELERELNGFRGFAEHILTSDPFPVEMSNHGYNWWRDVLTMDLQSILGEVSAPVLVIQGGKDESVSPEAVRQMVDELREAGQIHVALLSYPELNHGLASPEGIYKGEQVVADISAWLKGKLQAKADLTEN